MRTGLAAALAALVLTASATARAESWHGYPIIEWQNRSPPQLATLQRIGVTDGKIIANRAHPGRTDQKQATELRAAGMGFYVENIATDFYSAYHRWFPNKPVNWRFVAAQKQYRANPTDRSLLFREPSLSDPHWLARIRSRLMTTVRSYQADNPLYYDLGDESGIADLSAFWDFDLSPDSLAGMRQWLKGQYGSLAALNAEWGTHYSSWDAVQPETTRQAMQRTDGNFAAWSDFKAWMDVAYARALRAGTDAVHAADPHALAAIEGVQIPGWGGYNYTDLAHAVDVMEVTGAYGESLPLLHALNPRLIPVITSFSTSPRSLRRSWHATLNGARGLVLWDARDTIALPDGTLGPDGKIYAPLFAGLHRVGPVLGDSTPVLDPVAILYSPESFRLQWMLDQKPKGDAWMQRKSETELAVNAWRSALRGYMRSLTGLHLRAHFVTPAMLPHLKTRVLILPDTLSLSRQDAQAIAQFAANGGTVIADRQPGTFDGHGKRLATPRLHAGVARIVPPDDTQAIDRLLTQAGVRPRISVETPDGGAARDVAVYLYRHENGLVLGVERRDGGTTPREVIVRLPDGVTPVRDLLEGKPVGSGSSLTLTLGPIAPAVIQLSPDKAK